MPRIAQLKTIDGAIWCKLEFDEHVQDHGVVTLFTNGELKQYKEDVRKEIIRQIREMEL